LGNRLNRGLKMSGEKKFSFGAGENGVDKGAIFSKAVETLALASQQNLEAIANSFGSDVIEPSIPIFDLAHLVLNSTWHARCVEIVATAASSSGWTLTTKDKSEKTDEKVKQLNEMAKCEQHKDLEDLNDALGVDIRSLGNAYIEVIRDTIGRPAKVYHVPALTIRKRKGGGYWQMVNLTRNIGDTAFSTGGLPRTTTESKTLFGGAVYQKIFFKEYGDTRVFKIDGTQPGTETSTDYRDGEEGNYRDGEDQQDEFVATSEEKDDKASEIIHLRKYHPLSPLYGIPAFIASFTAMVSDEAAEKWNLGFFENNRVPRWLFKLIGQGITDKEKEDFKTYFTQVLKGRSHVPMIIAMSDPDSKIETEKLEADVNEGSFLQTRDKNRDEIIASHGVPPRMVGVIIPGQMGGGSEGQTQREDFRDFSVTPLQKILKSWINCDIIPDLNWGGAYLVDLNQFDTQSAEVLKQVAESTTKLQSSAVLSVNEARKKIGFDPIDEEWADKYFLLLGNQWVEMTNEKIKQMAQETVEDQEINAGLQGAKKQIEDKLKPKELKKEPSQ